jgi:hypothetical protein
LHVARPVRDQHLVRPAPRDAERAIEQRLAAEQALWLAAADSAALPAGQDHDPHAKINL